MCLQMLLQVFMGNITNMTYFKFNNKFYKQKYGLPMGNTLNGVLACLFLEFFNPALIIKSQNSLTFSLLQTHKQKRLHTFLLPPPQQQNQNRPHNRLLPKSTQNMLPTIP